MAAVYYYHLFLGSNIGLCDLTFVSADAFVRQDRMSADAFVRQDRMSADAFVRQDRMSADAFVRQDRRKTVKKRFSLFQISHNHCGSPCLSFALMQQG